MHYTHSRLSCCTLHPASGRSLAIPTGFQGLSGMRTGPRTGGGLPWGFPQLWDDKLNCNALQNLAQKAGPLAKCSSRALLIRKQGPRFGPGSRPNPRASPLPWLSSSAPPRHPAPPAPGPPSRRNTPGTRGWSCYPRSLSPSISHRLPAKESAAGEPLPVKQCHSQSSPHLPTALSSTQ